MAYGLRPRPIMREPYERQKPGWEDVGKSLVGGLGSSLIGAGSSALGALINQSATDPAGAIKNASRVGSKRKEMLDEGVRGVTVGNDLTEAKSGLMGDRGAYFQAMVDRVGIQTDLDEDFGPGDRALGQKAAAANIGQTRAGTAATKEVSEGLFDAALEGRSVQAPGVGIGPENFSIEAMNLKRSWQVADRARKGGVPLLIVTEDGQVFTPKEHAQAQKQALAEKKASFGEADATHYDTNLRGLKRAFRGRPSAAMRHLERMGAGPHGSPGEIGGPLPKDQPKPHGPIRPHKNTSTDRLQRAVKQADERAKAYYANHKDRQDRLDADERKYHDGLLAEAKAYRDAADGALGIGGGSPQPGPGSWADQTPEYLQSVIDDPNATPDQKATARKHLGE